MDIGFYSYGIDHGFTRLYGLILKQQTAQAKYNQDISALNSCEIRNLPEDSCKDQNCVSTTLCFLGPISDRLVVIRKALKHNSGGPSLLRTSKLFGLGRAEVLVSCGLANGSSSRQWSDPVGILLR